MAAYAAMTELDEVMLGAISVARSSGLRRAARPSQTGREEKRAPEDLRHYAVAIVSQSNETALTRIEVKPMKSIIWFPDRLRETLDRLIFRDDQRVTQTLASGTVIRQDFAAATRMVLFDSGMKEWQYATHGGTLFIVIYRGKPYAVTCRHVLQDFNWHQLVVTDTRNGRAIAGLKSVAYPSQPREAATDTDLLDVTVIEFSDDIDASFFKDKAYVLDSATSCTARLGDTLHVAGALKEKTNIDEATINTGYCRLELQDDTPPSADVTLRRAAGKFRMPEFSEITGLSGSPIFDVSTNALCGMVVRGTMQDDTCSLWYVDVYDICQLISAVHNDRSETYYRKTMTRLVKSQTRA